jgi:hypothetical protein
MSEEREGHAVGPPLPIRQSWYVLLRIPRTSRLKCAGDHHECTTFVL